MSASVINVHYYYYNHTDRLVRLLPFDDHGLHTIITEEPKYEARPSKSVFSKPARKSLIRQFDTEKSTFTNFY